MNIPYGELFFRWIANEYKPQASFRLNKVIGARIEGLEKDESVENLSINTFEDISKSNSYQLVDDDGERKYMKGVFNFKDSQYVAKVYKNGKITIDKQVAGPDRDAKLIFPWIYEDVVNIHNYWKSLKK